MAIAYGNSANSGFLEGDGGSSYSQASGTGSAGDTLIVYLDLIANAGTTLTLSTISGGSLTYTQVGSTLTWNTNSHGYVYVAPNTASSSAVTVAITTSRTIPGSQGQGVQIVIHRYSGVNTSTPIGNVASSGDLGQTNSIAGGSITVNSGNHSVLIARQKAFASQTGTPPTNWTERFDDVSSHFAYMCDRAISSTAAYNPAVTSTQNWFDSAAWHIEVAAAGGAVTLPPWVQRHHSSTQSRGARHNATHW